MVDVRNYGNISDILLHSRFQGYHEFYFVEELNLIYHPPSGGTADFNLLRMLYFLETKNRTCGLKKCLIIAKICIRGQKRFSFRREKPISGIIGPKKEDG